MLDGLSVLAVRGEILKLGIWHLRRSEGRQGRLGRLLIVLTCLVVQRGLCAAGLCRVLGNEYLWRVIFVFARSAGGMWNDNGGIYEGIWHIYGHARGLSGVARAAPW